MSREIKLIFHVGFGKTATTFLQSQFEEQKNILFVGKNYKRQRTKKFLGAINDLHYLIFRTYRREVVKGFANPSRTSAILINKYTDELVDLIQNTELDLIVLSDECIGDYGNYIGEWNLFLQIAIGNIVEQKLAASDCKVSKTISFTVRQQLEVIQSIIGYSAFLNVTSVDDFLSRFGSNPEEGWLGGYFYYSNIKLVESITDKSWKINVVPYEVLGVENDGTGYVKRVLGLETLTNVTIDSSNMINSNSDIPKDGEKRKSLIKPRNFFTILGFRLIQENRHWYKEAKKRKLSLSRFLAFSLYVFGVLIRHFGNVVNKLITSFKNQTVRHVTYTEAAETTIEELYAEDNRLLAQYIDLKDLIKFGYIHEPDDRA